MSGIRCKFIAWAVCFLSVYYGVRAQADPSGGVWKPASGAKVTSDESCPNRLEGKAVGGWSYATYEVPAHDLSDGGQYMAEMELQISHLSNRSSYPFLMAKKISNGAVERFNGSSVDAYRGKRRQSINVRFRYSGDGNLVLLLAKKIQQPIDFDVCINSTRIHAAELPESNAAHAVPTAAVLQGAFAQEADEELKTRLSSSVNFPLFIKGVDARCENLKKELPTEESYFRYYSELMEDASFAAVVKGRSKERDCVHRVLSNLLSRPTDLVNIGLGSAHLLKALALVDDGSAGILRNDERSAIRARAEAIENALISQLRDRKAWWAIDRASNYQHAFVSALGIACLRFPMRDEDDCNALAQASVAEILAALPDDGSSLEGPGYWSYSVTWLVNYLSQLPAHVRDPLVTNSAFLTNAAAYRISLTVPGFEMVAPIGDTDTREYNRAGTALRGLAMLTNSNSALEFAAADFKVVVA